MTITLNLSPETLAKLLEEAARQGKDISIVAAQLLTKILEWEAQDSEAAICLRHASRTQVFKAV